MLTDKALNVILGVVVLIALAVIGLAGTHIMQLQHEINEANKTIAVLDKNASTLGAAVDVQNSAIGSLAEEGNKAIEKSEQALAELQPFVEEEERRILGIRGAQQSSVSHDSAERLENIRQKMLKDALL